MMVKINPIRSMSSALVDRFDTFSFGLALTNHASHLSPNWERAESTQKRAFAYVTGMAEHVLYVAFKAVVVVGSIFANIALALHYLLGHIQSIDEEKLTQRKVRLLIGLLISGEAMLGLGVDTVGVIYPPGAYKAHAFLMKHVTRRAFERLGIVDYTESMDIFTVEGFWYEMEGRA